MMTVPSPVGIAAFPCWNGDKWCGLVINSYDPPIVQQQSRFDLHCMHCCHASPRRLQRCELARDQVSTMVQRELHQKFQLVNFGGLSRANRWQIVSNCFVSWDWLPLGGLWWISFMTLHSWSVCTILGLALCPRLVPFSQDVLADGSTNVGSQRYVKSGRFWAGPCLVFV